MVRLIFLKLHKIRPSILAGEARDALLNACAWPAVEPRAVLWVCRNAGVPKGPTDGRACTPARSRTPRHRAPRCCGRLAVAGRPRMGGGVNIDPAPGGLADHALPPPVGLSTPEPLRAFTDARGRTCRVYERRVMIEGAPSTALATICREPSGRWVLSR